MNRFAQVWQLDFIISLVIVVLAMGAFIGYFTQYSAVTQINDLSQTASALSESLTTTGSPIYWTNETVRTIGLANENGRINQTKLVSFYNLTEDKLRPLMGDEFYYKITIYQNNTPLNISGRTYVGFNIQNATSIKSLVDVNRYLLYNHSIVRMEVMLWA